MPAPMQSRNLCVHIGAFDACTLHATECICKYQPVNQKWKWYQITWN